MTLPLSQPGAAVVEAPVAAITALTSELIKVPSRGGTDDYGPIVDLLATEMHRLDLEPVVLTDAAGQAVAVTCHIQGASPGPTYVLDACLDTASLGDPDAWSRDPFSGVIEDGWLHGRGSADSKAAVAIFTYLAAEVADARYRDAMTGRLSLLFDLDEHTGGFAGIRRYLEDDPDSIAGVMIGYPGPTRVVTGGRGYYRAQLAVHGQAAHTGSTSNFGINAVSRASRLAQLLEHADSDVRQLGQNFPYPPKVTVTSVRAGEPGAYSVVPDLALLEVDVRLTPSFTATDAEATLAGVAAELDASCPASRATTLAATMSSWPAFHLDPDHPLPAALLAGAHEVGLQPRAEPAGPSNIGCYLASRGIPATAGFGVAYQGLHGSDEAIDLGTLPQVYGAYRAAVLRLLSGRAGTHPS